MGKSIPTLEGLLQDLALSRREEHEPHVLLTPIGGEVVVRGILSGTTLTLGLSLQRRERRLAGSDEAHFWGTKYFRIRANDAARRPGLREF